MKYAEIILLVIQIIAALMKAAEKDNPEAGSGAAKKEEVVTGLNAIFNTLDSVSTGGQKETLTAIKPLVSPTIDVLAGFMFPNEPETRH